MGVEPVPDEPAAVAHCGQDRLLIIADFHAGIEAGLRAEGVELDSLAAQRRDHLCSLIDRTDPDRLAVLGDLGHAIGDPGQDERDEIRTLLAAVTDRVPVTLVRGNHDGGIEKLVDDSPDVTLVSGRGTRHGTVGLAHGHTWPASEALGADVLCLGHEHPVVRLEDDVGGYRIERVWLRGGVDPAPFREFHGPDQPVPEQLVVVPAFNDRSGGTWVNVAGQEFLSPFLPDALIDGQAYLLDGTRLGGYRSV
jgi:hypothetical protein